jgi:hypothetical protein
MKNLKRLLSGWKVLSEEPPPVLNKLSVLTLIAVIALSASVLYAQEAPDVIKIKKDTEIPGHMTVNDVIMIDGDLTVLGRVNRNIVMVGGDAFLKNGSYVGGDIISIGGRVVQDPAAAVSGKVTQIYVPVFIPILTGILKGGWVGVWMMIGFIVLLGFLSLALVLMALVPDHIRNVVKVLEGSFPAMFLWGVLWIVLITPIAVLLAISVVGIMLIPLEVLLVSLAFIIGYIAAAVFIGDRVLISARKTTIPFLNAAIGIVVLYFAGFVPVVGNMVKLLFLIAGFGAVVTTRFGTSKR